MTGCKNTIILRESTPAERREDVAGLVLGGGYSLTCWMVIGWQLWSATTRLMLAP